MKRALTILLVCGLAAGCGIIPKRVEFFQDKVAKFPEQKSSEKEVQRETADLAKRRSQQTLDAALQTDADPQVIAPARDAAVLSDAVSMSLGPPRYQAPEDTVARKLAADLLVAVAKLNSRIDDFKADSNENVGKKIEGTGLFQVPYFVWLGIVGVLVFIGFIVLAVLWSFLKMAALGNPPLQLATGAVQAGANLVRRGWAETVAGGEKFKQSLGNVGKLAADPALLAEVKALFANEHQKAQSADVQELVKAMTKV